MNLRGSKNTEPADVVADLQAQVQQAQALASIPRQDLLADPKLNPATRGQADALTADRLRTELDLEHRRQLRRARERDRIEERDAKRLAAIDAARAATNPATTVLDMSVSRKRFVAGALGASLVCSIGSAMGVEAAAQAAVSTAPTGIGYVAEVAMTGMATMAIAWRGGLARSRAAIEGLPNPVLNAMIAVPLLASIVASTYGSGLVGAACSIGAAAFAWFAYLVSVTGSTAIAQAVDRMDQQTCTEATEVDEYESGAPAPLPRRSERSHDALEVVGEEIADQAANYLRSHERPSERSHESTPDDGGTDTASQQASACERSRSHGEDESTERVLTAQERRRLEGAQNRRRVASYLYRHPGAPTGEIASELGLGESTVRRIRKELENGGES